MGTIPLDKRNWDDRHISWWQRVFTSPKCPNCNGKMKHIPYPYEEIWQCKVCYHYTHHIPKNSNSIVLL